MVSILEKVYADFTNLFIKNKYETCKCRKLQTTAKRCQQIVSSF